ncbi:hypothetical protein SAMN04515691_0722 [Leifsonia sp. 98AMF]|uniref:C-glycoside deglycosidase beta subunit domain-containing protein n=1 Tax=unclassified Leifsonia TaxID=2663824 RepID=UPI00087C47CC|nr:MULTISPECIES: DUF6379 domain-containing protein [unclassified Leifsonia]SDH61118.1 hypothetical protein SAMN04515690_3298 [Leifsonia sp. 197AMF]SDI78033.1 hypothetical protein SAMN04515684_0490 [Leifsonia sp. 466MF]SDK08482.1 hypothetical protein SAMN04515683_2259 [Leifsonia sp. 157MF]SDN81470.1 hypothetical protein SAMN04515686_2692 [Leifsonia sp. 509MF]SEN25882.1 hypothetical protein SAMN04515685_2244 [Leifsonia sp. 467MF]
MFDELMLPDQADLVGPTMGGTAAVGLRLPWYRSLPLSCVEAVAISIDDDTVDGEGMTISVGDAEHPVADLGGLAEVEWFVLDRATVRFTRPDGLQPGMHSVALTLTLRIPYAEPEYWPIDFTQTAEHSRTVEFLGKDS